MKWHNLLKIIKHLVTNSLLLWPIKHSLAILFEKVAEHFIKCKEGKNGKKAHFSAIHKKGSKLIYQNSNEFLCCSTVRPNSNRSKNRSQKNSCLRTGISSIDNIYFFNSHRKNLYPQQKTAQLWEAMKTV